MRGVKPFKLGFLTRPFTWGNKHHLGITVTAFFAFDPPGKVFTDVEMWAVVGEELAGGTLDVGMPKSRAEFVVTGSCYTPGGVPATTCPVTAKVGDIEKTLYVIGDREWRGGVPTEPKHFTSMPVDWAHAFGGEGFDRNPLGKGAAELEDDQGKETRPLPNVESPGDMLTSKGSEPDPAGFGALDFVWPQRFGMAGTYDAEWLETLYPGFAKDIDWRIWQVAAQDQWREDPWVGNETFELRNMHPTKERVGGWLPGLKGRSFICRQGAEGVIEEVELKLTTVWLFPHLEQGVVLFQGATPILEDDGADIESIMVAADRIDQPRPFEHFQTVFSQRTGPEAAENPAIHLRDEDLVPGEHTGFTPEIEEHMKLLAHEGLRAERQRTQANKKIEEARAQLAAEGLDPDLHGPKLLEPLPSPAALDKIPELFEQAMETLAKEKVRADEEKVQKIAEFKAIYADLGLDGDELEAELTSGHRGPPKFSTADTQAMFQGLYDQTAAQNHPVEELAHYATDPEYGEQMRGVERELFAVYRQTAHLQQPVDIMPAGPAAHLREEMERELQEGASFEGRDLTGADFSGMSLEKAAFPFALMESANLEGSNLSQANLQGTVLAHANLSTARMHNAQLTDANLGGAVLRGADLSGSTLDNATLYKSDMRGAQLSGVSFGGSLFHETLLEQSDLSRVSMEKAIFLEAKLAGSRFTGASMIDCIFYRADLRGVDFGGADLQGATFLECIMEEASFVNARLNTARCVGETSWRGADFKGAHCVGTNFRGVNLQACDFSGATLDKADFSEANCEGARFYRAVARDTLWVKTRLQGAQMVSANLMNAIMQKADVRGVDFRGANLYAADFALIQADEETNVTDAIQLKVRAKPIREAQ